MMWHIWLYQFRVVLVVDNMDQIVQYVEPAKQFAKDSIRLVKRCTKPDRKGKLNTSQWNTFIINDIVDLEMATAI